jgi:hypothetical protein
MFLPEAWGFWMTLHGRKNWDDVTVRYWRQLFMFDPPLIESTVWADEKSLFWGWGFSKRIGDIHARYQKVLSGSNSVK